MPCPASITAYTCTSYTPSENVAFAPPPLPPRTNGPGSRLQIHYNGWPPRWDEWLSWDSPRIAPFRTRTQHLSQAQHVSPAPVSAVRNAPRTGPLVDDVRVLLPEVQRVLREISPMVEEVSDGWVGRGGTKGAGVLAKLFVHSFAQRL